MYVTLRCIPMECSTAVSLHNDRFFGALRIGRGAAISENALIYGERLINMYSLRVVLVTFPL